MISVSLRAADIQRGEPLAFSFDGVVVPAYAGESVAAALLAAGIRILRASPRNAQPRGAFCWMGLCQECTVVVDHVRRPACRVIVREGMQVMSGTIA
ncbi:(2Fe-2S)-binding protein [Lichenihabitans psoromatis]|uniref:(2Fe-2S)-binding protein n=1 Tax=Lichenihabitans psoromatis TaxID=2528642 RepID=UPI0010368B57|nr:(2Fe-2S)-binding protein [Lichenihabitans psoromatis]